MTNQLYVKNSLLNFSNVYKRVAILLLFSGIMTLLFQINTTGICHSKASFMLLYNLLFWGVTGYYIFYLTKNKRFSLGQTVFVGIVLLTINQIIIKYGVEWSMNTFYGCGDFSNNWVSQLISNNALTNLLCFLAFTKNPFLAATDKMSILDDQKNHCKIEELSINKSECYPQELAIKDGSKHIRQKVAEIKYIEVEKNCITLHTQNGLIVLYQSLKSFAEKLNPDLFVQSHRSYLVNIHFIEKINNLPSGDGILEMKTGEKLKVSRTYKPHFVSKFHAS